jgi:hypothetical protein
MNHADVKLLDYRAAILGPDGKTINVHEFKARNRGDATKLTSHLVNRNAVELWEGPQWIGTFEPEKYGGVPNFRRLRVVRRRVMD